VVVYTLDDRFPVQGHRQTHFPFQDLTGPLDNKHKQRAPSPPSPVSLTKAQQKTMPPRPPTKRPASETFASSSKKTRFLDPDEDPANFSEQVESNLEDNPRTRRKGRVRTEGYDSDSSDDGEGVVNSRKPTNDAEGDDDDDMFASAAAEEKKPVEDPKKDKNKFLRLGDIEGQEFGGSGLGDGSESQESDEPEDEDDAERRKKAGMGYELSSFNMREEMEEGKFSADGSYVRVFDPHAVHDRWLEDADERGMKKARRVLKQREKLEREKQKAEEKVLEDMGGKVAIEMQLLTKLKKGETVLEALQRLGAKKNKGCEFSYSRGHSTSH